MEKILAEKKNVAARNQDRSSAAGLQHFCSSKKRLPRSKKYAFKDFIFSEFFFYFANFRKQFDVCSALNDSYMGVE